MNAERPALSPSALGTPAASIGAPHGAAQPPSLARVRCVNATVPPWLLAAGFLGLVLVASWSPPGLAAESRPATVRVGDHTPGRGAVAAVWCRAFGRAQMLPIAVPQLAKKGG